MNGKIVAGMIGRRLARRLGGSGLLGAVAGIGVSILLPRLAPRVAETISGRIGRFTSRARSVRDMDDDRQSAGA